MVEQTLIFTSKEFKDFMMSIVPNLTDARIEDNKIILVYGTTVEKMQAIARGDIVTP